MQGIPCVAVSRTYVKNPQGKHPDETYPEPEAQSRFLEALKAGLKTPPKPLKDKPKIRKKPKDEPAR
jgi:hypothetical protein